MEIQFRLNERHIASFRKTVASRASQAGWHRLGVKTQFQRNAVVIMLFMLALWVIPLATEYFTLRLAGKPLDWKSCNIGFFECFALILLGATFLLKLSRGNSLRPNGPTLAYYAVAAEADGLHCKSNFEDCHYQWRAFDAITDQEGILVVWLETNKGVVIPKGAFANDVAAQEFLTNVSAHIANAKAASVL